jgi:hypothetical protein
VIWTQLVIRARRQFNSPHWCRSFGVLALALFVLAGPREATAAVFNPKTFTLDNGLQVVVIPNPRVPAIVQMMWYRVGAADEPAGKAGIAHFFEHLMFKGTPNVPSGHFSKMVARNGGRDNAFTSWDYTAYYQVVASDRLELVMKMEADRMVNLDFGRTDERRPLHHASVPQADHRLADRGEQADHRGRGRLLSSSLCTE